jgi:hypothetical protein
MACRLEQVLHVNFSYFPMPDKSFYELQRCPHLVSVMHLASGSSNISVPQQRLVEDVAHASEVVPIVIQH